jgi:hypothetical protein
MTAITTPLASLTYTVARDDEGDVVRTSVQARALIVTYNGKYLLMDDCERVVGTFKMLADAKAYVPKALAYGHLNFR